MKQKRDNIYIWATWLTKLISGEQQCEYVAWLKAHYKLDKGPSTFNSRQWNIDHTQLLHTRRDELESMGYRVFLEDQNSFKMCFPGEIAEFESVHQLITVSGKPDLVALVVGHDEGPVNGLVSDCKTGKPKDSDQVQVMIYMLCLPLCVERYRDMSFDGEVVYKDHVVPIAWTEIDDNFKELVRNLVAGIGNSKLCRKVPSYNECRWCDVLKQDCPEKVE